MLQRALSIASLVLALLALAVSFASVNQAKHNLDVVKAWGCWNPYNYYAEEPITQYKLANGEPLGWEGSGYEAATYWGNYTKNEHGHWELTKKLPIDLSRTIEVRLSKVDPMCINLLNERY